MVSYTGQVRKVAATEFKAKCLKLIDQVRDTGKPITITKRGKPVAVLQPLAEEDLKPWLKLRGTVKYYKHPFKPAVDPSDWDVNR
jgi:prevent-host-death family protein